MKRISDGPPRRSNSSAHTSSSALRGGSGGSAYLMSSCPPATSTRIEQRLKLQDYIRILFSQRNRNRGQGLSQFNWIDLPAHKIPSAVQPDEIRRAAIGRKIDLLELQSSPGAAQQINLDNANIAALVVFQFATIPLVEITGRFVSGTQKFDGGDDAISVVGVDDLNESIDGRFVEKLDIYGLGAKTAAEERDRGRSSGVTSTIATSLRYSLSGFPASSSSRTFSSVLARSPDGRAGCKAS